MDAMQMHDGDAEGEWMDGVEGRGEEEGFNEQTEDQQIAFMHMQGHHKVFSERISGDEYMRQGDEYTKRSVADLIKSPEYLQWHQVCSSCHANWYHGASSLGCKECEGFSMTRPCPICRGDVRCSALWERDVNMSHNFKMAHWSGKCNLPESEQHALVLRHLVDADPDSLADDMGDLANR